MKQSHRTARSTSRRARLSRESCCSRYPIPVWSWSPSPDARSATTAACATCSTPLSPDRYEDVAAAFQKASGRIRSLMARKLSVAHRARAALLAGQERGRGRAHRVGPWERDAARNKVAAPTDSDVPADADIMADREAQAQQASEGE